MMEEVELSASTENENAIEKHVNIESRLQDLPC